MEKFFNEVNMKLGFGCMRLPTVNGEIDYTLFSEMIDEFMSSGFNYFDTAHGYMHGKSESAIFDCLVKRYPRESFVIADKLTEGYFSKREDIRPFFENQLKACGVEYFDFYLMHAQHLGNFKKFKSCYAYETALELKAEGKIKHFGISFHDTASALETILNEYPQIEVVQIQLNYVDFEDAGVQSKKCYEICLKHKKPVIVMEPVKGGTLINLPEEAKKLLIDLKGGSLASYAIRFAASFDGVMMVLSGMSNLTQMEDNISFMRNFKYINDREYDAIKKVREIFISKRLIPCTACHYCTEGCPKKIPIPNLFADLNSKKLFKDRNSNGYYSVHIHNTGKASDCILCGNCEKNCPQHLEIRKLLKEVADVFENGK